MMKCKHEDAVYWNPYNQVVECHRCGLMFVPATDKDYVELNKRINSGEHRRREMPGAGDVYSRDLPNGFCGVSDIEVIRDSIK